MTRNREALSENSFIGKKNLNSMVSKVPNPFTISSDLSKYDISNNEDLRTNSLFSQSERDSYELKRNSNSEKFTNTKPLANDNSNPSKDDILNQWLKGSKREINTIAEDVDEENSDNQSRVSKATINSQIQRNSQFEQEAEEENELHKIHMLQSLQALQYMK